MGLFALRSSEAAEESIYDNSCAKHLFLRAQRCGLIRSDCSVRLHGGRKAGPVGRDKRLTAVGQNQKEIQSAAPMDGPKDGE